MSNTLQNIGWIGTGVMGAPMCNHLIHTGYTTFVHNRTRSKADSLLEQGALWLSTVEEVAKSSEIIFTMLPYPSDIEEVYFSDGGLLANAKRGTIFVDMSTTRPELVVQISQVAIQKGCSFLDAPVTGGDVGAKNATLSILVGGDRNIFDPLIPLFEKMGKTITFFGPAGSGQRAKLANQIVIAGIMIGVCEGLIYGYKSGLDLETLVGAIRGGAAGCWVLDSLAPRIFQDNFAPGFSIEHFVKDLGLALEETERLHIQLPGLSLAHSLYTTAQEIGLGKLGTHALYKVLKNVVENAPLGMDM